MFALAEVSKIRCQLKTPTDEPSNFVFLSIWTFLIQSDCVKHKMIAPRQGLTERAPLGADNHILEAPSGVKELNIYRDCYLGTNHSRNLPLAGLQETGRWGESTCLVSLRWLLLTVILKMAKMPIIRHVTNGRQGSPRFKGDPRVGWDELEPNRSYLSHFPTWYSRSDHFPIEIPIRGRPYIT